MDLSYHSWQSGLQPFFPLFPCVIERLRATQAYTLVNNSLFFLLHGNKIRWSVGRAVALMSLKLFFQTGMSNHCMATGRREDFAELCSRGPVEVVDGGGVELQGFFHSPGTQVLRLTSFWRTLIEKKHEALHRISWEVCLALGLILLDENLLESTDVMTGSDSIMSSVRAFCHLEIPSK